MSKSFIRLSILGIAVYLIVCYFCAYLFGIDLWHETYIIILEICVCLCISAHGKYHCKYLRWTAYGILCADIITSTDDHLDIFPTSLACIIPTMILSIGLLITTSLAIIHFIKVKRVKRYGKQRKITTDATCYCLCQRYPSPNGK